MKQKRPIIPIRSEIYSVNLLVIAVTVVLALGSTLWLTLWQINDARDENLLNSAKILSKVPSVTQALAAGDPGLTPLDFLDASIAGVADIDIIAVADLGDMLYYYPDRAYIGTRYAGRDQTRILAGEPAFTSDDTGPTGAERCAYAPVTGADGALLGFVMVGINLRSVSKNISHVVFQFLLITFVVVGLGSFLSSRLSRRIKGSLMGYEPDAFLRLFHQREDILEAMEEGILAVDTAKNILYINRTAAGMIHVDRDAALGRPLGEVFPRSNLDRVLKTRRAEYNVPMLAFEDLCVISDRLPLWDGERLAGAVSIFRDRTELTRMAEDLTGVRHMVEAMRAYTHEFMNKLHVVLGLLQIGEPQRAEEYIMDVTRVQREVVGLITERIKDPSVAALLVGKTSRASEMGIRLTLAPTSRMEQGEQDLPSDAYVTILGNLIENAVDALNQTMRGLKEIAVTVRSDSTGVLLCVEDTGPGMDAETSAHIFQSGFSTKGKHRGTGLSLVYEMVTAYQGEIRAESEPGVGTAFFVTFRHRENGEE